MQILDRPTCSIKSTLAMVTRPFTKDNMNTLTIRPARPDDAPIMHALLKKLADSLGMGHLFTATIADITRNGFGHCPYYHTLLAEYSNKIIGLVTFMKSYSTFNGQAYLYIDSLYVEDSGQNLHVGQKLIAAVCQKAVEKQYSRVDLHIPDWNPHQALYDNLDMQRTGHIPYQITEQTMRVLAESL
ncbi:GNAT family N-acetyltransferase [Beggiatoa leptomitoformis]|uniref:GNAT family N-acetyltransferase n=1 Tax=Beggiatoa leptomitoformis TaxID=288004 RepID=A0A2N9YHH4_9GAMM|nr:GNAT family N-acetyltransferase [Beggiatoa leptomitoformis]ALG67802.1 GNAT family N-acetyltransferase [Beggiatoa leptomitoformis]AUI69947.1 GNAT family N-acetyltransferase [Beggiatoa leptomitoformis]